MGDAQQVERDERMLEFRKGLFEGFIAPSSLASCATAIRQKNEITSRTEGCCKEHR